MIELRGYSVLVTFICICPFCTDVGKEVDVAIENLLFDHYALKLGCDKVPNFEENCPFVLRIIPARFGWVSPVESTLNPGGNNLPCSPFSL